MTMDSAGRVPLPPDLQAHLGLRPGDQVELRLTRDGRVILDKASMRREMRLAGEPERSVIRHGSDVRLRFGPPKD
ncbi:MAG: AbrB/MazE/SpoVT family DNA-binding domain-containing protein [Myxococcales bacterium]|nr:AbrB/MazE/SpoVT family DNA-binding domain-containing protein [Myxococcales bacterium]MCB9546217.1 AbrB/MazE/SpoVT family DNA-binding domain-containing protein [Myxococcales bacterium]